MELYAILILLTVLTAAVLIRPWLSPPFGNFRPRSDHLGPRVSEALEVDRARLNAIETDLARGLVTAKEAGIMRPEIERRILTHATDDTADEAKPFPRTRHSAIPIAVISLVVTIGSFGLYERLGAPELPGEAYAARVASEPRFAVALALERAAVAVRNHPDVAGYNHLGDLLFQLGHYDDAAEAYRKARELATAHP